MSRYVDAASVSLNEQNFKRLIDGLPSAIAETSHQLRDQRKVRKAKREEDRELVLQQLERDRQRRLEEEHRHKQALTAKIALLQQSGHEWRHLFASKTKDELRQFLSKEQSNAVSTYVDESLTSPEVCEQLGCRKSELNRWAEDSRLSPVFTRSHIHYPQTKVRFWTPQQVAKAKPLLEAWRQRDRQAMIERRRAAAKKAVEAKRLIAKAQKFEWEEILEWEQFLKILESWFQPNHPEIVTLSKGFKINLYQEEGKKLLWGHHNLQIYSFRNHLNIDAVGIVVRSILPDLILVTNDLGEEIEIHQCNVRHLLSLPLPNGKLRVTKFPPQEAMANQMTDAQTGELSPLEKGVHFV